MLIEQNRLRILRVLFWFFFSLIGVVFFSKIKLHKIFGTPFHFSLLTIFGPNIEPFGGALVSITVFTLGRLIQILLGFSKGTTYLSYIVYLPMIFASHYFAKLVNYQYNRGRPAYPVIIPLLAMVFFILHPIGRAVWYYSLYWLIPMVIYLFANKLDTFKYEPLRIYLYALAATYIDHAIGSVMYLYALNIPAIYWNMALPYVPLERAVFALGITLMYYFIREAINALRPVIEINVFSLSLEEEVSKTSIASAQLE